MASPIKNSDQGGKRPGQKYKSLLVWQYLLKRTDEDHAVNSKDISTHLSAYGITADRHSIARDIEALTELFNKDFDADIEERERLNYEVEYDYSKKGYKISVRPYDFQELRLLAECINAAKFLTEAQANNLKNLISDFCSEYQAEQLQNEVYLVGRVKSTNEEIMSSIITINEAIRHRHKISLTYLRYTIENRKQQSARRKGAPYILSPYQLIINEGNYYLLAYTTEYDEIRTFRIDRMKEVKELKEPREGDSAFEKIDMRTYTQRVFSMFSGEEKRVSIRFTNDKLNTVVDRFGPGGDVFYRPDGPDHFVLTADIEISDQFYSWICGFRKKATILTPPDVVEGMKEFLADISNRYESE